VGAVKTIVPSAIAGRPGAAAYCSFNQLATARIAGRCALTHRVFGTYGRRNSSTEDGTKLVSSAINNQVLFEADGSTADEGWSVIVKGMARSPRTDEELEEARRAWLFRWTATPKPHFVRIRPLSVTGRRFVFGPEPGNESTFAQGSSVLGRTPTTARVD